MLTTVPVSIKSLEEIYPDDKLWGYKQKTKQKSVSLKIRDMDNGNLVIKFHLSTGVIVIQGSQYQSWGANEFANLKARVDTISVSDQDTGDSHIANPRIAAVCAASFVENCAADNLDSKGEYGRN